MKEVTLKIPNNKIKFFKELVKNLGFEITIEDEISETQKSVVMDRIEASKEEDLVTWDKARKKIEYKNS
ncbi:hypothetical protein GYB29_10775 [bacterium]|nr:hypothetical protein [bacterium]